MPSFITNNGNIGTVFENSNFNFNIIWNSQNNFTLELISGVLPAGITFNPIDGNISGIAPIVESDTNFLFTIRLTDSDGFIDGDFSILVQNTISSWATPTDLGSILPNFYNEIDLRINNLSNIPAIFEKISGTFPYGLELNRFGVLNGIVDNIDILTIFNFTIRALLANNTYIDQSFTLTVDPNTNTKPIWITPSGIIDNLSFGDSINYQLSAAIPNGVISYSALPSALPPGIVLSTNGILSGNLSDSLSQSYIFNVTASAGPNLSTIQTFQIDANKEQSSTLSWITQNSNLGTINEGEKSLLGVTALSTDPAWLRYNVTLGSLPEGLILDINSGDLQGSPLALVSSDTTYTFTITANDDVNTINKEFTLTLANTLDENAIRVYAGLYGKPKLLYTDLFTTPEIILDDVFRLGDKNFGLIRIPKILIVENLKYATPDAIFDSIQTLRRTYLSFGHVEVGYAVQNQKVVYEVLYRRIIDSSNLCPQTVVDYQANPNVTTKPGSLVNVRNELITQFGSSIASDVLPLWMTSEQTIGDPISILGYTPALEFAYLKPGFGSAIAEKINNNDIQLKKLYNNYIRMDRIIIEPTASYSFNPQIILFDNKF